MQKKDYVWPLIVVGLSLGVIYFTADRIRSEITPLEHATLLPHRFVSEALFLFLLPMVCVFVADALFGRFMLWILIWISKMYQEEEKDVAYLEYQRVFTGKRVINRTLVPAFIALGIGLTVGTAITQRSLGILQNSMTGNIVLVTVMCIPLVSVFIYPIWLAEDIGIAMYKRGVS